MKVSVVVVTYNHAAFIEQALASVLMQETSFDFEVIVSEDCSTDGTRAIVERWRDRDPSRIRLLLSERNVHSNAVVARGFRAAAGQYVALLDGDDYWTSPRKLQLQADLLDAEPSCAICFHDAAVVDAASRPIAGRRWAPADQKPRATLADLWGGNFLPTCSTMFRKDVLAEIPTWYDQCDPMITDWPLYVLHAEHGDLRYIPEVMGAYRLHDGGLYSPRSAATKLRDIDRIYHVMNAGTGFRHDAIVRRAHRRFFLDWTREHRDRGEPALAKLSLRLSLRYGLPRRTDEIADTIKLGLALHARFGRRPPPPVEHAS